MGLFDKIKSFATSAVSTVKSFVASQPARLSNVVDTFKSIIKGGGTVANVKSPIVKKILETVTKNPVSVATTALAATGGAMAVKRIPTAIKAAKNLISKKTAKSQADRSYLDTALGNKQTSSALGGSVPNYPSSGMEMTASPVINETVKAQENALGNGASLTAVSAPSKVRSYARKRRTKKKGKRTRRKTRSSRRRSRRSRGRRSRRLGTAKQYSRSGGKKVYYTKNGQPYIKLKDGRARFIKGKRR